MWPQAIAALVFWVLYGVWLSRRKSRFAAAWQLFPGRRQRIGLSIVSLLVSALVLGGGLALITVAGQVSPSGFTAVGFLSMTLVGLLFVYLQSLAAATMITLVVPPETEPDPNSSDEGSTL